MSFPTGVQKMDYSVSGVVTTDLPLGTGNKAGT